MADLPDRFYVTVNARALVNGKEYPLQAFSIKYALDEIPRATMKIALGRGMSGVDKGKVSSGHGMLSSIAPFTPMEIHIKLRADDGRFSKSKDDSGIKQNTDQVVFKGFMFTPEQTKDRAGNSATMTFRAIGYPAALGGSTQFSAGLDNVYPDASGVGKVVARLGTGDAKISSIDAMLADSGVKNTLNTFILLLFDQLLTVVNSWGQKSANTSAKAALDRMKRGALGAPDLFLDYKGIPAEYYNKALCSFFTNEFYKPWRNPMTGGDLWAVLRALADKALFHIVPAIEHDAMAPVTYGLGGKEWRSFEPSDYWAITMDPEEIKPENYTYIGRVGMVMPSPIYGLRTTEYQIGKTLGYAFLPLGKNPLGGDKEGRLITVPVPDFMICPATPGCGLGGMPTPDAADPETKILETNSGSILNAFVRLKMGNGYAETVLKDKVFGHRKLTVTGRFRLDIAPGSLVKITTIGERFVSESEELYGHAHAVILTCGDGRMETEVGVLSVRTKEEHGLYTAPSHPLYNQRWAGAMLTD
jgi:hypothetical protein